MRKRLFVLGVATAVAFTAAGLSSQLSASVVVGGSTLLNQAYADQLETWLGEGPITLTKIYAKQTGDDSFDFHAAVDGKGRTFSVIEILANSATDVVTGQTNNLYQIIGGYNPQSWRSDGRDGDWNYTPADADRTAFLFNLTTSEIQRQSLTAHPSNGEYQTYNWSFYGPTFGGGHDIHVRFDLSSGYTYNNSYGGTSFSNNILSGGAYYHNPVGYGAIEVFQITAGIANSATPEPTPLLIWTGLIGLIGSCRICSRTRSGRDF
jgi:hypothetical protein